MDWTLEVVVVPVTDVDRALGFYRDQVGFTLDHDSSPIEGTRVVQLTPPGSGCSIAFGTGVSRAVPGSLQGVQLVVSDIDTARRELSDRGVNVSEVTNFFPDDDPRDGGRFIYFSDPDGNGWSVQEIRARAPS